VACLCFALLLLTKIYMAVLLLPLGVMVLLQGRSGGRTSIDGREGWLGSRKASPQQPGPVKSLRSTTPTPGAALAQAPWRPSRAVALAAATLAVLPAALWCVHALRTAAPDSPHAAHVYSCLQGNAAAYRPPDPLLRTFDFYRQMLDDLTGAILTPLGFALFLAGFLDKAWRRHAAWLLAMMILVALLPRKFYDMNYYHVAVLPPLCVVAGLGWKRVAERLRPGRTAAIGLMLVAIVLSLRYAARPAFVTPEEDRGVVAAGRAVQELTAPDEPVATMHGTTIDLVYYCNRPGWAIEAGAPELASALADCRRQGARYLVVAGTEAGGGRAAVPPAHVPVVQGGGFSVYRLEPDLAGTSRDYFPTFSVPAPS
jgi:hypothetical protein